MHILAIRSVQLSTTTTEAWKAAGVTFARRGHSIAAIMEMPFDTVLNLGKSNFIPENKERIWNHGKDIHPLLWPGATRELVGDLMPPQPTRFPADVWIKAPGMAGRGNRRQAIEQPLTLPKEWDWQSHIEGQEYRLITVGNKVVQDMMRQGDNNERIYQWLPMADVPIQIKRMVRKAAKRFAGKNIIAWDTVLTKEGDTYIFEGNTCPGVNTETVERIIKEMEIHNA